MTFNIGDRVRLGEPRLEQEHMRGWEGEIISHPSSWRDPTISVTLHDSTGTFTHTENYFLWRLELVEKGSLTSTIEQTIRRLQKRQKFYQTYKTELPTWYAAYGD